MFLITLRDHPEGVYATVDEEGDHVIYFFKEEDDADRYLGYLEAGNDELPPLKVQEVDPKSGIGSCELKNMKYIIVEPDDLIVPPRDYDNFQED